MKRTHFHLLAPSRSAAPRRGSILILVLVLLAIMTLFVSVWSYVARLEARASQAAGKAVQARIALAAGLPAASDLMLGDQGQPVATPPDYEPERRKATGKSPEQRREEDRDQEIPEENVKKTRPSRLAAFSMRDPGGLLNLNALRATPTDQETNAEDFFTPAQGEGAWALRRRIAFDTLAEAEAAPAQQPLQADNTYRLLPAEMLQKLLASQTGASPSQTEDIAGAILERRSDFLGIETENDERIAPPAPNAPSAPESTEAGPEADRTPQRGRAPHLGPQAILKRRPNKPASPAASRHIKQNTPANEREAPQDSPDDEKRRPPIAEAALETPSQGAGLPLYSLEQLREEGLFDAQELEALAPFLTVYSTSLDVWHDASGLTYARLPLNRATARDIVKVLEKAYPSTDIDVLRQFAANAVDRRDPDAIPTRLESSQGAHPILGYEMLPCLSEVCPDVITFSSDGDNGEFIEIYNPFDYPVQLRGWRLDWAAGSCFLNVTLAPRGFLIVTDDIDDRNDPSPEDESSGMGSFYDVFRIMPGGATRQAQEVVGMNIPDDAGRVQLFDNLGNLVDYLTYDHGRDNDNMRGFHKTHPFQRRGRSGPPTPYETQLDSPSTDPERAAWTIYDEYMNTPYQSVAELLAVPSGAQSEDGVAQWRFPSLSMADNLRLDLRLLDCFVTGHAREALSESPDLILEESLAPWTPGAPAPDQADDEDQLAQTSEDEAASRQTPWKAATQPREPVAFGKININTAPREVLAVLPAMTDELVDAIVAARGQANPPEPEEPPATPTPWQPADPTPVPTVAAAKPTPLPASMRPHRLPGRAVSRRHADSAKHRDDSTREVQDQEPRAPFSSLASFAANETVWASCDPADRIARLIAMTPLLTVNTTTWDVRTRAWTPSDEGSGHRHTPEVRALVHLGARGPQVVRYTIQRPGFEKALPVSPEDAPDNRDKTTREETPWDQAKRHANSRGKPARGE